MASVSDDELSDIDEDFFEESPAAGAAGARAKSKPKPKATVAASAPAADSQASPPVTVANPAGGRTPSLRSPSREPDPAPRGGGEGDADDDEEHDRRDRLLQSHRDEEAEEEHRAVDEDGDAEQADESRTCVNGWGSGWNWRTLEERVAFRAGLHASQSKQRDTNSGLEMVARNGYKEFMKHYVQGRKYAPVVYTKGLDPPPVKSIARRGVGGVAWKRFKSLVADIKRDILPFLKK
jgi:hypothetical protein